jgi:hypothetical protein
MSNDLPNPDTPDWLPALACALFIAVGTWALAPWLSELVGGANIWPGPGPNWRAGVSLADGGAE